MRFYGGNGNWNWHWEEENACAFEERDPVTGYRATYMPRISTLTAPLKSIIGPFQYFIIIIIINLFSMAISEFRCIGPRNGARVLVRFPALRSPGTTSRNLG